MTIFVKKFKKKSGGDCYALMCNNGKREKALTFDKYIIADYLGGMLIKDLETLDYGKRDIIDVAKVGKE